MLKEFGAQPNKERIIGKYFEFPRTFMPAKTMTYRPRSTNLLDLVPKEFSIHDWLIAISEKNSQIEFTGKLVLGSPSRRQSRFFGLILAK